MRLSKRQREQAKLAADLRGIVGLHADAPTRSAKLEAQRQLAHLPADTRDLTARVFGDPLPGRSALDKLSSDIGGRAG